MQMFEKEIRQILNETAYLPTGKSNVYFLLRSGNGLLDKTMKQINSADLAKNMGTWDFKAKKVGSWLYEICDTLLYEFLEGLEPTMKADYNVIVKIPNFQRILRFDFDEKNKRFICTKIIIG